MKTKMWKMMIAAIVILPMTLSSCHDDFRFGINGVGEIEEQTVTLEQFDGFVSTIPVDVYLTQGDHQEVVIAAQGNIIDNIELEHVDGGIWTIRYHEPVQFAKPVKIYITMPTLTKAAIVGSGSVIGETDFTGLDQLELHITGSGDMDLYTESDELNTIISGSGDIRLSGKTDKLKMVITGSGNFHGKDLQTGEADLTISGSGSSRLSVSEFLQVLITGSGNVYYTGNPEVDLHVSGSGGVIHQ